jgi:hypothetical protein|tara:strand:+ start:6467 stop:6817 length:351 start_codon:yes stop_codon:yes gene_type:complete
MNTTYFPKLTEPGVSYFLKSTLKQCSDKKGKYFNTIFNLGLLFLFLTLLGVSLVYKKNTKMTTKEKKAKHENEREYILNKIKSLKHTEREKRNEIITTLPKFESNFVELHKNYYKI